MTPETDLPLDGEILPPELANFITMRKLEMEFDDLARVYGYARALELWSDIPKEHGDASLS